MSVTATTSTLEAVTELGRQLRVQSITMAERAGSGHPTSSMSAADLVAVLIGRHLVIDPMRPDALGNDRLVFSKGHASPLLYATLDAIGAFDRLDGDEIGRYRTLGSVFEGHPTPQVPGVAVATGSLGVGLPAGVGLALGARDLDAVDSHVWVVCGDSELAEGSMWEAIEHAGSTVLSNLTAIIDVNRLGQTGPTRHGWDLEAYDRRFRAFDWDVAMIDGHDIAEIDEALTTARRSERPMAVIARTHKGSGAAETEDVLGKHGKPLDDPRRAIDELGGVSPMRIAPVQPDTLDERSAMGGRVPAELPSWPTGESVATRSAFGDALTALARSRGDIVALDGEVGNSTGLDTFGDAVPERFFQLYISEQLMIAVATGMQVTGWRPFAATFAAFVTRAHDLLRMATIGRANLCVVGSHAGVSIGEDGPSQMGLEDLAMMRSLHGSTVLSPCDANQTAALVATMADRPGITYLRTLRGKTPVIYGPDTEFRVGGSVVVRESDVDDVTIVGTGVTVHAALDAADRLRRDGVPARVIDAYSVKPIDEAELARAAGDTGRLVIVEDHHPEGGLGDAVRTALAQAGVAGASMQHLAVRHLPGSASPDEQQREAHIDSDSIVAAARYLLR